MLSLVQMNLTKAEIPLSVIFCAIHSNSVAILSLVPFLYIIFEYILILSPFFISPTEVKTYKSKFIFFCY